MSSQIRSPMGWTLVVVATLIVAVVVGLLWTEQLPLGIEGEWMWSSTGGELAWPETLLALGCAFFYGLFVVGIARWFGTAARVWRALMLLLLLVSALVVQWSAQTVPLKYDIGTKWPFSLYSFASSGYFTIAQRTPNSRFFLENFHEFQKKQDPYHVGTHPPGLVILQHELLVLCRNNKALTDLLLAYQPSRVRRGFEQIRSTNESTLTHAEQCSMWLMALVSQVLCIATIIPIYVVSRRIASPMWSWCACALWPLIPSVIIFMPKSDVLYPLLAMSTVACALSGKKLAGRTIGCMMAAAIWNVGMFLSLAMLTTLPIIGLALAFQRLYPHKPATSELPTVQSSFRTQVVSVIWSWILLVVCFVLVSSLLAFGLHEWSGFNMFRAWADSYMKHRQFYDLHTRTYSSWVLFNVFEVAIAIGIPLSLLALSTLVDFRSGWERQQDDGDRQVRAGAIGVCLAWGMTLVALNLSGKNLGEAARLWIILMPFALPAAAWAMQRYFRNTAQFGLMFGLQVVQALACVTWIQGFVDTQSLDL